jgi:16S rRNA (uracil1498-N3)-methyltransferase
VRLASVPEATPVALLVGPEGGLTDSEIRFATAEGFASVKLGPFVLRTETATTAALGAIAARW